MRRDDFMEEFEKVAGHLEKSMRSETRKEPSLSDELRKAGGEMEYADDDADKEGEEEDEEEGEEDMEHKDMGYKSHTGYQGESFEKSLSEESNEYISAEPILQDLTKAINVGFDDVRLANEPLLKAMSTRMGRLEKQIEQLSRITLRALPLLMKSNAAIKDSVDSLPANPHIDRGVTATELMGKSGQRSNGDGQSDQDVFLRLEQAAVDGRIDPKILSDWNVPGRGREVLSRISPELRKSYGLPEPN